MNGMNGIIFLKRLFYSGGVYMNQILYDLYHGLYSGTDHSFSDD